MISRIVRADVCPRWSASPVLVATATASEASEAEESDRAWGWDSACTSKDRSTSDILPTVVNHGAGHRCVRAASGAHEEAHPAVVRGASGGHEPETDNVLCAVSPVASSGTEHHAGGGGVEGASGADRGAEGKVACRPGRHARIAHLAATGGVEEVHAATGGVGIDVPSSNAGAWAVAQLIGLDVDVAAIDVDGASEVDDATVNNGGI